MHDCCVYTSLRHPARSFISFQKLLELLLFLICLLLSNIFGRYCTCLSIPVSLLDAPEGGEKGSGGAAPIGDELDIFGPMVSNPLPSSNNTQQAQVMHSLSLSFISCLSLQAGCNTQSLQRKHTQQTHHPPCTWRHTRSEDHIKANPVDSLLLN